MENTIHKYIDMITTHMDFLDGYGFDTMNPQICADVYITYISEKYFIQWSFGAPEFEVSVVVGRRGVEDKRGGNPAYSLEVLSRVGDFSNWCFSENLVTFGDVNDDLNIRRIFYYISFFKKYSHVLFSDQSYYAIYDQCANYYAELREVSKANERKKNETKLGKTRVMMSI